ncbi:hypothetical protein J4402_02010 [Candidatus Pacearchaeota archaeon]|nr:hypothetical protein [uncultured archaeon]AQS31836.1 hypothetical protein [uncultured archaeon]MBS3088532.1 hypothetical protein [Candidatus Pacearchaeota archaeon]
MKRAGRFAKFGLIAAIAGAFGQSCSDVIGFLPGSEYIEPIQDAYGYDASLPPKSNSKYANKFYNSNNTFSDEEKILNNGDGEYGFFECTKESPLELIVGFGKEFSTIRIKNHYHAALNVKCSAVTPVVLAGLGPVKYAVNSERTDEKKINPNPWGDSSDKDIRFNIGRGNERIVKIEAYPLYGFSSDTIHIDCLKTGGLELPPVNNSNPYAYEADVQGNSGGDWLSLAGAQDRDYLFVRGGATDIIATTQKSSFDKIKLLGMWNKGGFKISVAPASISSGERKININGDDYFYSESSLRTFHFDGTETTGVGLPLGETVTSQAVYLRVDQWDGGEELHCDYMKFE